MQPAGLRSTWTSTASGEAIQCHVFALPNQTDFEVTTGPPAQLSVASAIHQAGIVCQTGML